MNFFSFQIETAAVIILLLGPAYCQSAKTPEKASTRFDPVHFDRVLADPKMRENYISCLMDKGVCTPEAYEVKSTLPAALNSHCEKCNKRQKTNTEKTIQYLMDKEPDVWQKISAKYDPKGTHKKWYTPAPKKQDAHPTESAEDVSKN